LRFIQAAGSNGRARAKKEAEAILSELVEIGAA